MHENSAYSVLVIIELVSIKTLRLSPVLWITEGNADDDINPDKKCSCSKLLVQLSRASIILH